MSIKSFYAFPPSIMSLMAKKTHTMQEAIQIGDAAGSMLSFPTAQIGKRITCVLEHSL